MLGSIGDLCDRICVFFLPKYVCKVKSSVTVLGEIWSKGSGISLLSFFCPTHIRSMGSIMILDQTYTAHSTDNVNARKNNNWEIFSDKLNRIWLVNESSLSKEEDSFSRDVFEADVIRKWSSPVEWHPLCIIYIYSSYFTSFSIKPRLRASLHHFLVSW